MDTFANATDMLHALHTRQITAVELLELHLCRIERYNPRLNAIVIPNYDEARRAAAQADVAQAQGEIKPLLGLPLTIKDCIHVKGLPVTGGVPERASVIAEEDAPVAARVRAAGGVIMGKTNVPPYAGDYQSNNPLFGRSNNPWDLSRTPGGSTGGGAAAVAAGLTPLEFGGDLAGSIRVPAAFCGVYGHKTSETAVPRRGHFPGPNTPNAATAMAVQGPLARSAEDLELAFDVIAGPDIGEDVAWRLEVPPARHERLADYRVAVLPPIEWLPVDAEITAALDKLATRLGRAGAQVKEVQPEALGDLRDFHRTYASILAAVSSTGQPKEERHRDADAIRRSTDHHYYLAIADGLEASASDYVIWFTRREYYRTVLRAFFEQWNVLFTPVNVVNAFPHTDAPKLERRLDVNGTMVDYEALQTFYPLAVQPHRIPGNSFPGWSDPVRAAHRRAGGRPLPGRPHADPFRRARGARVWRLSSPAWLR